jgi:peptidoglycan/xylan/chitin deacetylase (PgdA/CDA1 family)
MNSPARLSRLAVALIGAASVLSAVPRGSHAAPEVSILAYHRFGSSVADAMTVRTTTFRWQLDYLRGHGHPIVPLRDFIAYRAGHAPPPPAGSVCITADDGHESVFTVMLPIVRELRVPVTLFVYPSAISNASYAMTWEQLAVLRGTGLFDIQSHTYWHPNFTVEKRRLSEGAYREFAMMQLTKSRGVLESTLGVGVELLAWPFGIADDELVGMARDAGYTAGFTLKPRIVTEGDSLMTLPRFLVTDSASGARFAAMLPADGR